MYTVANKQQIPVYVIEFKVLHKVTIPKLVAGLYQIDLAKDIIY